MTIQETKISRDEWIKSIKVGDEVCVTNSYNISVMLGFSIEAFTGKTENDVPIEICEIRNVRGVLDDGAIIVDDSIYKSDGTPEKKEGRYAPELYPVTDELRENAWRVKFYNDIRNINWKKVSSEGIEKMIDIINSEIQRIEAEEKSKQLEKELSKAKETARWTSVDHLKTHYHAKDETLHNLTYPAAVSNNDEVKEIDNGGNKE